MGLFIHPKVRAVLRRKYNCTKINLLLFYFLHGATFLLIKTSLHTNKVCSQVTLACLIEEKYKVFNSIHCTCITDTKDSEKNSWMFNIPILYTDCVC